MGKAKKRILHKSNSSLFMTREVAVSRVYECFNKFDGIKRHEAEDLVTLFGLSAEELSEGGLDFEHLKALGRII